jgi:GntR family transcriptional regulator
MALDHDAAEPQWRQLAATLRAQIESGELAPGDRLPSILTLSQEYEVASVTVRKALNSLKQDGLISAASGWRTFVTEG